ncbi:MAG: isoaspartyl peptidase/L-asparaginase, partial [Fluviicola sp.]
MERRKFLHLGSLGIASSVLLSSFTRKKEVNETFTPEKTDVNKVEPKMISTWNHGQAANLAGWEAFKKGGTSLDMVEQGARQTESDVKNRSVGIGGMPDREGHVTLDACI